jgi:hypothetical protein
VRSLDRLRLALAPMVTARFGRISTTLSGTALLVSSASGASRIVDGVPSALAAMDALFPTSGDGIPSSAGDGDGGTSWPEVVEAPLPSGLAWEPFALWIGGIASGRVDHIREVTALVLSDRGSIAVDLRDGHVQTRLLDRDASMAGSVRVVFTAVSPPSVRAGVLAGLADLADVGADSRPSGMNQ